jgi:signal transduction histidine kinase
MKIADNNFPGRKYSYLIADTVPYIISLIGSLVLAGWLINNNGLARLFTFGPGMKPTTAFTFILTGISLWLIRNSKSQISGGKYRAVISLIIIIFSGNTILYYFFDFDARLDVLFLFGKETSAENLRLVRMAPATSFNFLLIGFSLLLYAGKAAHVLRQLIILTSIIALFSIIVFFIDSPLLAIDNDLRKMSLLSGFTFFITSAGFLSALSIDFGYPKVYLYNKIRGTWRGYALALGIIIIAASLRLWPLHMLGLKTVWVTFYPAVMLAALFGGIYSGLFAAILSCFTVLFLWPLFVDSPYIKDHGDLISLSVFVITSLMISVVCETLLREREKVKIINQQFGISNRKLKEEISGRIAAENEINKLNRELEQRVCERTKELEHSEEKISRLNKELEQRVNERTAQLEEALKELEAFSYSVSHDLRAPLRHIMGFIEILRKKSETALDENGKRYLSIIHNAAGEMGQLIEDLLSFSRIGRSAVKMSKTDFNSIVSRVIEQNREEIEKRNIDISVTELPVLTADPNLFQQVWTNLISNAIKYTGKCSKPKIEIGYEIYDGKGRFCIRDNGAGFDMRYYDKLFGVFQRLHSTSEFEGTGIGLANVKKIIDKHGGRIWAEGKLNEGAVFYFSLPQNPQDGLV